MATLIPDTCPSKATAGEKRVFELLRDLLPGPFTAWYEPVVAGRFPDFTVVAADFGLLMLEVKGWYAGQIARADPNEVELHRSEGGQVRVATHKHPSRQAREYLFALVDQLARPEFAILRHHEGPYAGRPVFPCAHGVVLTNITRSQLDAADLTPLFPPDQVVCRDELATLAVAGPRAVVERLRRLFAVSFPFEPLTEDQLHTLKGALHREVVVRRRPATVGSVPPGQPLVPGAVALDVLDAKQEQAARSIGSGHQVIFGIAGSGKSVLLSARARLIADRSPGRQVLILCYNKVLAAATAARFAPDAALRRVEVRHFHSWVARKTGLRKRDGETFDDYERRVVAALLGGLGQFPDAAKYDAVLIDEGHDFEPDWIRCAVGMLRGGPEGDLVIAVDGAQSLYGRPRSFTWKSVGVNAVGGRSRRLTRNYRNTKPIVEFAWQVGQSLTPDVQDSETHVRLLPERAARNGPPPVYRGCPTVGREHALVARLVADFRARGLAEGDIAVLYPRRERDRIDGLCRVLREKFAVSWVSNEADPNGGVKSLARPGVRLMTVHAAKGLEFPAVVVTAVDQLPSPIEPDLVRDSNLLYVALTRATDHLAVTWVGRSEFTDRVQRSNKGVPVSLSGG